MVQIQNIKSKMLLLLVALLLTSQSYALDVIIPDAAFKNYLVNNIAINTNSDTEIQVSEANAYTGYISCASLSITDMTGIEAFTSLTSLYCQYNNISNLDLSNNTALLYLYCFNNNISVLNINGLSALTQIQCYNNSLSTIDFSTNTSLTNIDCKNQSLTQLDLSNNTALEYLYCENNSITTLNLPTTSTVSYINCSNNSISSLNISGYNSLYYINANDNLLSSINFSTNTGLTNIFIDNNPISNLDFSAISGLMSISCSGTNISSIDVSANTSLTEFTCDSTNLTFIDISANTVLAALNCRKNTSLLQINAANGNNTNFYDFKATDCSSLTCVKVDNVSFSSTNWTDVDNSSIFNLSCAPIPCDVYIPDAVFKAALLSDNSLNTNSDTEIQCSEASAFTGTMTLTGIAITDITGIEAFTSITSLFCGGSNSFTSIDISALTNLTTLSIGDLPLTSLNISQNTALENLYLDNCNLTTIDLSNNTALQNVSIINQNLTSLDLSQNTSLQGLGCQNNGLTSLDVTNNTNLTGLYCENNSLTSLDVSQNSSLQYLECTSNQITSLDVSQNNNLLRLYSDTNNLSSLNVANVNLSYLDFKTANNPNLQCITVNDPNWCTINWTVANNKIDNGHSFHTNCSNVLVTSLTVQSQGAISSISTGNTLQMTATILPTFVTDGTYTWSVNNANATIDANGLLTAVSAGTVIVTASANDASSQSGTITITITTITLVNSISVQGFGGQDNIGILGGTLQMEATVLPASATNATYTWSVDNGNATISSTGLLTAVADGYILVTATSNDGSNITDTTTIQIFNQITYVSSITVQGQGGATSITTNGGTLQMEAVVLPANADDATYTWSVISGNATISSTGLLTAVTNGTVTVRAIANDAYGEMGTKTITISNQTGGSVAINDITFTSLKVFPNPTSGIVNIVVSEPLNSIILYDLSSKTVKEFDNTSKQIDVSSITSGIYFLQIANNEKQSIVKLIVR